MRAVWSGEIAFGVVAIPVKLYPATRGPAPGAAGPSFYQVHIACGTRTSLRRCPACERQLAWDEIGQGYEVARGEYAVFTREELVALESVDGASAIEVTGFVDPSEIDSSFVERSYWVGPGGKSSRAFAVLLRALENTKKAALARVRIRSRTRLGLLRPRGHFFALDAIHFAEDMVDESDIDAVDAVDLSDDEVRMAVGLVESMTRPFERLPPDRYVAAVRAAVDEKVTRGEIVGGSARRRDLEACSDDDDEALDGSPVVDLAAERAKRSGARP